jgi:hypothetical protein
MITIVGDLNMAAPDFYAVPASNIFSYTPSEGNIRPSAPLSEGAVRLGNSLLSARVPEHAIRRDVSEGF